MEEEEPSPLAFIGGSSLRIRYVEEEEIKIFGDPETLFFNINTKEDFKKAEEIATQMGWN